MSLFPSDQIRHPVKKKWLEALQKYHSSQVLVAKQTTSALDMLAQIISIFNLFCPNKGYMFSSRHSQTIEVEDPRAVSVLNHPESLLIPETTNFQSAFSKNEVCRMSQPMGLLDFFLWFAWGLCRNLYFYIFLVLSKASNPFTAVTSPSPSSNESLPSLSFCAP